MSNIKLVLPVHLDIWDEFGKSVSVNGDILVVGVPGESSSNGTTDPVDLINASKQSGAAYVFRYNSSNQEWEFESFLKTNMGTPLDSFGESIAVYGDIIVVGAPYEDSSAIGVNGDQTNNDNFNSGAAYVFRYNSSNQEWNQEAYLKASNSDKHDNFGKSVSIYGDIIVVGAPQEDSGATGVNGDQTNNDRLNSGAAYVFRYNSSTQEWNQEAYLKASNTSSDNFFGDSVSVNGDIITIGAYGESLGSLNTLKPRSGAAYVFRYNSSTQEWEYEDYLKASTISNGDNFGKSVSVNGDIIVVGSYRENCDSTGINGTEGNTGAKNSGAAYVFRYNSSTQEWSQEAYLKASNTDSNDNFGYSVVVDGDYIVVGSPKESSSSIGIAGDQSNNDTINSGAVYVFRYNSSTQEWSQEAYIKGIVSDENYYFGNSVGISNTNIVVGVPGKNNIRNINGIDINQRKSGGVYIYNTSNLVLVEPVNTYFKGGATYPNKFFGRHVSLGSNFLVVGSIGDNSNSIGIGGSENSGSASNSGSVNLFRYDGDIWENKVYLKASNALNGNFFGSSIAAKTRRGRVIVVGAPLENSLSRGVNGYQGNTGAASSGAVYVFRNKGQDDWRQEAFLKASNTSSGSRFGTSVDINYNGTIIVVGAPSESSGNPNNQEDDTKPGSGAVYIFRYNGSSWEQEAYLKPSTITSSMSFGKSISLDPLYGSSSLATRLIVGAPNENSNTTGINGNENNLDAPSSGAVYVFKYNSTTKIWEQEAYIKASNTTSNDNFGSSVGLDLLGKTFIVGSPGEKSNGTSQNNTDMPNSGAAYVFEYNESNDEWEQTQYIKSSNPDIGDNFGSSVKISRLNMIISAPGESSNATGINGNETNNDMPNSGAVYSFEYNINTSIWEQQKYIKASNTAAENFFGTSIELYGNKIAVGAYGESSNATGVGGNESDNSAPNSGAVYVF